MTQPTTEHSPPVWTDEALTTPHSVPDKAARVRSMFDSIAPTYEAINRIFSLGRDAAWRRKAVKLANVRPEDEVLDIACGTGDFTRAFARAGAKTVVGSDFAHHMLVRAAGRDSRTRLWCEADALRLPFADGSFTVTSCAFGVRNFSDLLVGLKEMHRVLQPGGRVVILEFTNPRNPVIRSLNNLYSGTIMPMMATLISRDRTGAYKYLPRSVESFLSPQQMTEQFHLAGFSNVRVHSMTFGIVAIYLATKP